MQEKLVNNLVDIKALEAEFNAVVKGLGDIENKMDELAKKSVTLHLEIKSDKNFEELVKNMKEYNALSAEITNTEKQRIQLNNQLEQSEKKLAVTSKEIQQVINDQIGTFEHNIREQRRLENLTSSVKNEIIALKKQFKDSGISADDYANKMNLLYQKQAQLKQLTSDNNIVIRQQAKEMYASKTSMNEMSITLGNMRKAYRGLTEQERNSPIGRQMVKDIQELDATLKKADATIGNHQRKVGDYEGATVSLRTQIRALVDEMSALKLAGKDNTLEYQNLAKKAGTLQDAMNDVRQQTQGLASDTKNLDATLKSLQSLQAAFMAVQSIEGFAEKGSTLAAVMDKLKIAIASVSAAVVVQNTLQKQSVVMQSVYAVKAAAAAKATSLQASSTWGATVAQKAFNLVAKANPYVLLATALITVVGALVVFSKKSKEATDSQKELNEQQQKIIETTKKEGEELKKNISTASLYAKGSKERANAIKSINESYGNYLSNLLTEKSSAEDLKKAYEELQPVLIQQAILRASLDKIAERGGLLTDNLAKQKQLTDELKSVEDEINKARMSGNEGAEKIFENRKNITQSILLLAKQEEEGIRNGIDSINSVAADAANSLSTLYTGSADSAEKSAEYMKTLASEIDDYYKELTSNLNDYLKKTKDFEKDSLSDRLKKEIEDITNKTKIAVNSINSIGDAALLTQEDALQKLSENYKKGEISAEEYQRRTEEIRENSNRAQLEAQIAYVEKYLKTTNLPYETQYALEQQLFDLKRKLRNEDISDSEKSAKNQIDIQKKMYDTIKETARQAFDTIMDFMSQQSEARIAEYDAELERIDADRERELQRLDESVMSDETRAAETKRINEQAEKDRQAIEQKKKQEQKKAAQYQKDQASAQTLINTYEAASKAYTVGPVAGPILAGIITALGLAQVARIQSQKLPEYALGTEDHPGGYAVVGDGGKKEYIYTPTGKLFETPAKSTLMDIPAHSQVFPDAKSMMQFFRPEIPSYSTTKIPDFSDGIDRIEKAVKQIKPVQNVSMSLDNNGIWYVANGKSGKISYMSTKVRQ